MPFKLVASFEDDGKAPEIFTTGIAAVSPVGGNAVRITYVSEHAEQGAGSENRVVVHIVMDVRAAAATCGAIEDMLQSIRATTPPPKGEH